MYTEKKCEEKDIDRQWKVKHATQEKKPLDIKQEITN